QPAGLVGRSGDLPYGGCRLLAGTPLCDNNVGAPQKVCSPLPLRRSTAMCRTYATGLVLLALAALPWAAGAEEPQPAPPAKHIDVVICLDVSNSMDGLIASAKAKLWDIVNGLAQAKPTPALRVGLYSYGNDGYDRNVGWVRKELDLTTDLDTLYQKLNGLTTN